jgi:hypothetical protein
MPIQDIIMHMLTLQYSIHLVNMLNHIDTSCLGSYICMSACSSALDAINKKRRNVASKIIASNASQSMTPPATNALSFPHADESLMSLSQAFDSGIHEQSMFAQDVSDDEEHGHVITMNAMQSHMQHDHHSGDEENSVNESGEDDDDDEGSEEDMVEEEEEEDIDEDESDAEDNENAMQHTHHHMVTFIILSYSLHSFSLTITLYEL